MRPLIIFLIIITLLILPSCVPSDSTSIELEEDPTSVPENDLVSTSTSMPRILIDPDEPVPESTESHPEAAESSSDPVVSYLSNEGPWLVYMGSGGLNGINQDASGKTVLMKESENRSVLLGPGSPSGRHLIVSLGDRMNFFADVELFLLHLPSGEFEEISPLLPVELSQEILERETEEIHAVLLSKPSWSPSGEQIAFVAVIDGPSSDLYVYDLEQEKITRLTSGPNQALYPYWTPDGSTVIHFEGENLISMSEEHPRRIRAVWAVDVDSTRVTKLLELPPGGEENPWNQTRLAGWAEDGDLLIYQNYYDLELDTLQERYLSINLVDGLKSVIDTESISSLSEINPLRELIFRPRVGEEISSPDQIWQGVVGTEGINLVHSGTDPSIVVSAVGIDVFIWKPDSSGFYIASDHNLYMADLPVGDLVKVDSSVSDLEDHFSWVLYNID
jgi:hypothetical protein